MQLTLFCHAATAATRRAAFPAADDALEPSGREKAAAASARFRRVDAAWTSPARAARETALAFDIRAIEAPALREIHYGSWTGRDLADIEPGALATWLTDPSAAPHRGETIAAAVARTAAWMASLDDQPAERVVAVTHASILRAAIITALAAPLSAFWRIDIAPLSRVSLQRRGRDWTLRSVGR